MRNIIIGHAAGFLVFTVSVYQLGFPEFCMYDDLYIYILEMEILYLALLSSSLLKSWGRIRSEQI